MFCVECKIRVDDESVKDCPICGVPMKTLTYLRVMRFKNELKNISEEPQPLSEEQLEQLSQKSKKHSLEKKINFRKKILMILIVLVVLSIIFLR